MRSLPERLRSWLLAWPGRLETPAVVKRRLMVVATVMAMGVTAAYSLAAPGEAPWTDTELRDLAGLPDPPARFAPTADGDIRRLTPEEFRQLQEIRYLIERFPVPDQLAGARRPAGDRGDGQ